MLVVIRKQHNTPISLYRASHQQSNTFLFLLSISIQRPKNLVFCLFSSFLLLHARIQILSSLSSRIIRGKAQTDAVHAMPLIRRRRIPFALENMAQVAAAFGTCNLRTRHAKRAIRVSLYSARDTVKVSWPAAARLEFVLSGVEGCFACCAFLFVFHVSGSFTGLGLGVGPGRAPHNLGKSKKKEGTYINTLTRHMFIILARKRRLGPLLPYHPKLLR